MQLPDLPYTARVEESLTYLSDSFETMTAELAQLNADAAHACRHAGRLALGGKHVRPLLTHIACDRELSAPTPHADVRIAAAFDMLHCAFLLVDDVLDDDDLRRGVPTLHAAARQRAQTLHGVTEDEPAADHYGRSVAILAGMAAQNHVTRILLEAQAPAEQSQRLLQLLTQATGRTIIGEFMDIHHSLPDVNPDPKDVEITNRLKTSIYSFEAPLIAGRILGGVDDRAEIDAFAALGRHLGAAYQIADDLGSAFASPTATGKAAGGDMVQGRATLLMGFAATTSSWPAIAAELGRDPVDTEKVSQLLLQAGADKAARAAIDEHLHQARDIIYDLPLSTAAADALNTVATALKGGLNATLGHH